MNCSCYFMRAAIGTVICAALSPIASAQDAPKADDKQISGLISKLGDKDFATRDQAQKDLIAMGPAARPGVAAALASGDLEIAQRAKMVLLAIGRNCFEAASKKAQENILWSFPIKGGMVRSPCIKDGVAYVAGAGANRTVYAVDLKTGKEKWSQAKLPGDQTAGIYQVALSDAVVVVALSDGTLAGLDFAGGKVNWKREPPAANPNAAGVNPNAAARAGARMGVGNVATPIMVAQGSAVCYTEDTQLVILDAKSGEMKLVIDFLDNYRAAVRPYLDSGHLIFQAPNQRAHCYTLDGLKDTWPRNAIARPGVGQFAGSILCNDGKVYFAGPTMTTAIELATGAELWKCQADDPNKADPGSYAAYGRAVAADSLKIIDGTLYEFDGTRLAAIDLKETKFTWSRQIEYWHDAQEDEPENAQGIPAAIQRRAMLRGPGGMMMVNGRWVAVGQGAGAGSATIEGTTAYAGASSPIGVPYGLYAIGLSDGLPLWRLKGVRPSGAPVAHNGVLYFGTEEAPVAAALAAAAAPGGVGGAAASPAEEPTTAPADDGKVTLPLGLHALKVK